jgi:hypothetical protein
MVALLTQVLGPLRLYQPAHTRPHRSLEAWVDKGLLDVRSPFETVIDRSLLETALRDFKGWAQVHGQTGLALLKEVGNSIEPANPETPQLISQIKGLGRQQEKALQETGLSAQLFLHLAQEFDKDAWELSEQLKRVDEQYQSLQRDFRQDQEEMTMSPLISKQTFSADNEDRGNLMTETRLVAWNRLFQESSASACLLVTDSLSAFDHLLECVENRVGLLNLEIQWGDVETADAAEIDQPRPDGLLEAFHRILKTPWRSDLKEAVRQAGHEIASKIVPPTEASKRSYLFSWYAVPGLSGRSLLNKRCGKEPEPHLNEEADIFNAVVGLVQETSASQ